MRTSLMRQPTPIGALVGPVLEATRTRAPLRLVGTGLGAPNMVAFRARLDTIMHHVAELWPYADVLGMRSALLMIALKEPDLMRADDDQLSAFCLHAAESRLHVAEALTPIVDRDPRTGVVTVAAVEKVKGLIQQMRDAGAKAVTSGTVYEGDTFKHDFVNGVRDFTFIGRPGPDRGAVMAFFALVDLPQGQWQAKVLTVAEVA